MSNKSGNNTPENNLSNVMNIIVTIFIVGVLTVTANYYILDTKLENISGSVNTEEIKKEMQEIAALEFGGMENYEIAKQAFTSEEFAKQQKEQLEQFVSQFGGSAGNTDTADTTDNNDTEVSESTTGDDGFDRGTISKDQIDNILSRGFTYGDENAKIVWLEYTDPNCVYCARHTNDGTVINSISQFEDNEVSYKFRPFPIFGEQSMPGAYAFQCAGELGDNDVYYNYKKDFFALSNKNDRDAWDDLVSSYGVDVDAFNSCIDNAEVSGVIEDNLSEGRIFGVSGTPGNVLLDTTTGDWVLVPGAYPSSQFVSLLEGMLN
ncbi:DsbA family protein [Candidatus Vampirococcus lugosii]|uniref:Protein-disulfide isomerase n=1 Tax=Candidatus Vampirococcus lugosii TaxID=2789015 RepID=A0ABS5QNS8_9BACT|nr:thioredoxin domain-containing protein [Candidatus Vampirococcus lugosii]MBS8122318.1 Protein-disulfide isomerase [Candidatus Vampirococcus lugosii]